MSAPAYTRLCRRSLHTAKKLAIDLGHPEIEAGHVFAGIVRVAESPLADLLEDHKIISESVEEMLESMYYPPPGTVPNPNPQISKEVRVLVGNAVRLRSEAQHRKVSVELLLLVLVRDAMMTLRNMVDTDFDVLAHQLTEMMVEFQKEGEGSRGLLDGALPELVSAAHAGKLEPVLAREQDLKKVMGVLMRRKKNNPLLVGDPGVGKTALVKGLAQKIASGEVPPPLLNRRVYLLETTSLLANSRARGELEARVKAIVDALTKDQGAMLFVDEFQTVLSAAGGQMEGFYTLADLLKPALADGRVSLIGAVTSEDWRRYVERDRALTRRMQPIMLEPLEVADTVRALVKLKPGLERHHQISIEPEAVVAAARLSDRYLFDRVLPDKAIDLLDEACSQKWLHFDRACPPQGVDNQVEALRARRDDAFLNADFGLGAELTEQIRELTKPVRPLPSPERPVVTERVVASVLEQWAGVKTERPDETEREKLADLENRLAGFVVGQGPALSVLAKTLRRHRAGLTEKNRPLGVFLFVGPTGVGKTETAKSLSEVMFGSAAKPIRLDMSEFSERYSVSKLLGAAPGYVGYQDGGRLTNPVRRRPHSVLLLDEIEKAHPKVFDLLLQVFDDGKLTDSSGQVTRFGNTIIIMTSNLGSEELAKAATGFAAPVVEGAQKVKSVTNKMLRRVFRPEFVGRVDEVVTFRCLTEANMVEITDRMVSGVCEKVAAQGCELVVSAAAKKFLAARGFSEEFGARPLRRVVESMLEYPLSDLLLLGSPAVVSVDHVPGADDLVFVETDRVDAVMPSRGGSFSAV